MLVGAFSKNNIFAHRWKHFLCVKEIKNQNIEAHNFSGFSKIINSNINNVRGAGKCVIFESNIGRLAVSGFLRTKKSTYNNPVKIVGYIYAESCNFNNTLIICSNKADFKNCNTKDIVFSEDHPREEKLILKNTTVDGSVTFKSGKGKISMDSQSFITHNVNGAITEKI